MVDLYCYGDTLPNAYHKALMLLNAHGEIVDCKDYNTRCKECAMTFTVANPLAEPMISGCIPCGPYDLERYTLEMVDGIMDFEVHKGNWKYTYHDRMTNQINFVVKELTANPNSRKAVISIRDNAKDMYSENPACLQHIQYAIRNGKLDCFVTFRSNDAVRATFMNAFALIMLQKKFADELGVEVGTYSHRANSFHAYEVSWDLLASYDKRIKLGTVPIYSYKDEWKELMLDEKPKILKEVERLKNER